MDNSSHKSFAKEVDEGLSAPIKRLNSKWFYDEIGNGLFEQIMKTPEYYLTECELEIFVNQSKAMIGSFGVEKGVHFDLYELGAGDGTKTIELLKHLQEFNFTYHPIDISQHAIDALVHRIEKTLPDIKVEGIQGEYFEALNVIKNDHLKIILFLGSNLGNMLDNRANEFLVALSRTMRKGDKLLLGIDLKKSKEIVLPAYNDSFGLTAEFNLNLLRRINRELGGDFKMAQFKHAPVYDEEQGMAMSFLESTCNQSVRIDALNKEFHFKNGESIFMEVSRKYDDGSIAAISINTNLDIAERFYDKRCYYCDLLFVKS